MDIGNLNPIMFSIGDVQIRYYSAMYVVGFIIGRQLLRKLGREGYFTPGENKADELVCFVIIGILLGIRIGYVFFYNWDYYSQNLNEILHVWTGGLSFHGGVVGGALGAFIFSIKNKVPFLKISDAVVICATQGVFFGRIGNFINGELYGRVTDSPIGIVFKHGGPFARHPSQIYEAFAEGLVLFLILWLTRSKFRVHGITSSLFMCGYGSFRFIIEFYREADPHLGYFFSDLLTMGQILCFAQVILAIVVLMLSMKLNIINRKYKKK